MWMKEMFGTDKPVIGMMHLMAMPTDPKYDEQAGLAKAIDRARHDLHALQEGGIDGVLFTNEFSIPYTDNVRPVTIACMARIIGELKKEIKVPFGVNVAVDPYKALDLACAVEADFIRGTFFGAFVSDDGISSIQMGEMMRHKAELHLENLKMLATIVPEGAKQISERPIEDVVKSVGFSMAPDAMLVFGLTAGRPIDDSLISRAKQVTSTPVFASNGVKASTVEKTLSIADGCVVGTSLKYDGQFYEAVDQNRVKELMDIARKFRGDL
ncbi:MAG: BtpA/SgcQ family protein [Erysipelotrichaceae bacterium]|nr:BtpA/SgcQ family protein [Erysipelotrichaceae bacterium]